MPPPSGWSNLQGPRCGSCHCLTREQDQIGPVPPYPWGLQPESPPVELWTCGKAFCWLCILHNYGCAASHLSAVLASGTSVWFYPPFCALPRERRRGCCGMTGELDPLGHWGQPASYSSMEPTWVHPVEIDNIVNQFLELKVQPVVLGLRAETSSLLSLWFRSSLQPAQQGSTCRITFLWFPKHLWGITINPVRCCPCPALELLWFCGVHLWSCGRCLQVIFPRVLRQGVPPGCLVAGDHLPAALT